MASYFEVYGNDEKLGQAYCLAPSHQIILKEHMNPQPVLMRQWKVERRSTRLELAVPVLVYGWARGDNSPFTEITRTLDVNAHGGLLALTVLVQPGQMLLLVNNKTEAESECRVVRSNRESGGKGKVGFEFMRPEAMFWELAYDSRRRLWQSVPASQTISKRRD